MDQLLGVSCPCISICVISGQMLGLIQEYLAVLLNANNLK